MTEYKKTLRENDNQRSAIFNEHGIVYYRGELGALLLKRPDCYTQIFLISKK